MYDENAMVVMRWNAANKNHFVELGYQFTQMGDEFNVRVGDLNKTSQIDVPFTCDVCGKQAYRKFVKLSDVGAAGPHACSRKCGAALGSKTNIERYGAARPLQVKKFMEKAQQTTEKHYGTKMYINSEIGREHVKRTMIQKYGVDHYSKTDEFKEKFKQTSMERYGVENPMRANEVKQKIINTTKARYGVEHVLQSPDVRKKIESTCVERYGGKNCMSSKTVQARVKQTMMEHYGVDNPLKSDEIKQRVKQTNIERYGHGWYTQAPEFQDKFKKTMNEKYGVDHALQSEQFQEVAKQTTMEHYGVEHPLQNDELREKFVQTMYADDVAPSSRPQRYICNVLGGELNYPVGAYLVDCALVDSKIAIEYDGSGHDLCVRHGGMTQQQFAAKERQREAFLHHEGWRLIRLISNKDLVPDEEQLKQLIKKCVSYLDNEHQRVCVDFDLCTMADVIQLEQLNVNRLGLHKVK